MIGRFGCLFGAALLAGCQATDSQIADEACPFVALTKSGEVEKRLKIVTGAGMNPSVATSRLFPYESIEKDVSARNAPFDRLEFCQALLNNDKQKSAEIVKNLVEWSTKDLKSRGLISF